MAFLSVSDETGKMECTVFKEVYPLLKNIETMQVFAKSDVKIWECRNCGHIVIGTNAPEICPVCAHPQSYFEISEKNY